MKDIDLQEIKEKLFQKLKSAGWGPATVNFIMSSDFDNILEFLYNESLNGKKWTPQIKNIFRAFEECPYDKLNVVIIGQDPYPQVNTADGIAFSCSLMGTMEKSLKYIYDSIERTVDQPLERETDLKKWSNQGILMLNSALTTTIGKPGAHQANWKPFTAALIDHFIWHKPGLIYVFLGKKAQEYADMIPDNHYKIFATHPAAAAYTNQTDWDCNDLWNKINKELEEMPRKKFVTEGYTPLPEFISIRSYLDVNSGEFNFIVFSNKRHVKAKGLYDALSIFGINYDAAKQIVSEVANEIDTTHKFRTKESSYTEFALSQRFQYDNQTVLRYP